MKVIPETRRAIPYYISPFLLLHSSYITKYVIIYASLFNNSFGLKGNKVYKLQHLNKRIL